MCFFTFIIPHRVNEDVQKNVKSIESICDNLKIKFEIISISGTHPTYQRNFCIKKAIGKYIYFLDNDSEIELENFYPVTKLLKKRSEIEVLGGPALLSYKKIDLNNKKIQLEINTVFTSIFATGVSSARYMQKGKLRKADDREIILCNLIIKKKLFEKYGLFNEKLYPNEENEWIARIKNQNIIIWYDPNNAVYRLQRSDYKSFIKQMFNYGRGRAEQTLITPASLHLQFLLPALWVLYLFFILCYYISLVCSVLFDFYHFNSLLYSYLLIINIPLFAYGVLLFFFFLEMVMNKIVYIKSLFLFIIMHFTYGLGFLKGIFISQKNKKNRNIQYLSLLSR